MRALAKVVRRLDVADNGLCFGRLDTLSGNHSYIGRIGLFDEENDYEPVLLDWRAPAARAFYVATAASPENMRRRRQFHTRGRVGPLVGLAVRTRELSVAVGEVNQQSYSAEWPPSCTMAARDGATVVATLLRRGPPRRAVREVISARSAW